MEHINNVVKRESEAGGSIWKASQAPGTFYSFGFMVLLLLDGYDKYSPRRTQFKASSLDQPQVFGEWMEKIYHVVLQDNETELHLKYKLLMLPHVCMKI